MAVQMKTERKAHTTWEGDLLGGSGQTTLASGAAGPLGVTWKARTEANAKTSPEELIAAAHASCFSMALAGALARAGTPPARLETDAVCTFEQANGGWRISRVELSVRGQVDGVDDDAFRQAAEQAKENCPVSQALKGNVELSVDASLA
jgi:osmotically inducible protein OsmC